MRRNMNVPTMARRTTIACVDWSAGQSFTKHTNKFSTEARRSATPATMSSPGLIREKQRFYPYRNQDSNRACQTEPQRIFDVRFG
jgi:hypothetical protein